MRGCLWLHRRLTAQEATPRVVVHHVFAMELALFSCHLLSLGDHRHFRCLYLFGLLSHLLSYRDHLRLFLLNDDLLPLADKSLLFNCRRLVLLLVNLFGLINLGCFLCGIVLGLLHLLLLIVQVPLLLSLFLHMLLSLHQFHMIELLGLHADAKLALSKFLLLELDTCQLIIPNRSNGHLLLLQLDLLLHPVELPLLEAEFLGLV